MKEIEYESLIAGLLLKFKLIDNVDFSLITKDFEDKTRSCVFGLWDVMAYISKYIKYGEDKTISLKDGITLDYFIEEENQTLQNKLSKIAGYTVLEYLNNLDTKKYRAKKEKSLIDNKQRALNEARVLLISDIEDDYDELIKYGFKNVNYFKSIIRANAYFIKHPQELGKYHLILKGHQTVQRSGFETDVELDDTLKRLKNKEGTLVLPLHRYDFSDHIELITYLSEARKNRHWKAKKLTYTNFLNEIIENMLINHTLEKESLKNIEFIPIQDKINPNRLPFPKKKSDLKILCLTNSILKENYAYEIANLLGLNITFKEDNNCGFGKYVKSNLGEYDIIIANNSFSGYLLSMGCESTEQCKDTGRELTMLTTYHEDYWISDKDLGYGITLRYTFGGNSAPNSNYHSKIFSALKQNIEIKEGDEAHADYIKDEFSQIKAIIEASVNFYNETLIQLGKNSISDLDLKTADELNKEYTSVEEAKKAKIEEERKRIEAELAPIKRFDNIRYSILKYLSYRKKWLINEIPEGLKITEDENSIKVENIYQGKPLCTIIFSKEYKHDNLRIFKIQTLTKKGTLTNPQTVGVYTSQHENLKNIPNRPGPKQESALISIEKKINVTINPLIEEALRNKTKQNFQEAKILKFNKKNRRRT